MGGLSPARIASLPSHKYRKPSVRSDASGARSDVAAAKESTDAGGGAGDDAADGDASVSAPAAPPAPPAAAQGAEQIDEEEPSCTICLCEFEEGEAMTTLPCLHLFHKRCIDRWLLVSQRHRDRSCPLCKMDPLAPLQLAALQPEADETGSSSGAGAGAGATPGPAACVRSPLLPPRRVSTLPSRLDGAWGP